MKKKLFYIILFTFLNHIGFTQGSESYFDHYTVEDGLSQSEVNCIFQDSRGLIWFGTQSGLNRFDGEHFTTYNKIPLDSTSISDGWIYSIVEDKDNNLWIGTKRGLNRFNPKTEKFEHFFTSKKSIEKIKGSNAFYGIHVDKHNVLWIISNSLLIKFNPKNNLKTLYPHTEEEYFSTSFSRHSFPIVETEQGLWFGSNYGLQFFSKQYAQIYKNKNITNNQITSLAKDEYGNLFIGTNNGLIYYDTYRKKIKKEESKLLNDILKKAGGFSVSQLFLDSDQHILWISTVGSGIIKYDLNSNKSQIFKHDENNKHSLTYDQINTIYKDNSNSIWIGIAGKGINKYSPKLIKFSSPLKLLQGKTSLSDNIIGSIYANKNQIWLGTWSGGLNIIDKKTHKLKIYSSKNNALVDNHIHVILKKANGNIWLGTRKGISIYNFASRQFSSFEDFFKIKLPSKIKNYRIYSMAEDVTNNIIAIGTQKGFFCFNTKTKEFSNYPTKTNKDAIKSSVHSIFIEKNKYWIGSTDGLYLYNLNTNKLQVFRTKNNLIPIAPHTYKEISSSYVLSIVKGEKNIYWIGTDQGINKYDAIKNEFKYYTIAEGLPNNTIYEIINDDNNNIWFSTTNGIGVLYTKKDSIINFTNNDGLQDLEFNAGASYITPEGEIFFGGINGVNSFFPDSIKTNSYKPKTVLLSYTITDKNGEGYDNPKSLIGVDHINMSYSDNSIEIRFAAIEYTNPSKNQYQYKLEGKSNIWIPLNTNNFVTFSGLKPGDYILHIKGSNNDLIWGEETTIKIHISAPFYNNPYAYFFYIALISFIIYRISKNRADKLNKANEEIRNRKLLNIQLEQQREELNNKNESITDSINYAKYIQDAMIPSKYLFKKLLPNSFILYLTKDIVSGDFYWITQRGSKTFIAAVDCTGHGVPGAFLSIIGLDFLRNIVKERGIEDPAEILNQLNHGVSDIFRKSAANDKTLRDGMDITICVIDKSKQTVQFSGAMNPLCLIRDNSFSMIKGNRFSIGSAGDNENLRFETHTLNYQSGDMFYMFSDGYADQFGGPLGKKFKPKRLFKLLLNIHHLSPEKQQKELQENFFRWKGQIEQIDDVMIIGFKL